LMSAPTPQAPRFAPGELNPRSLFMNSIESP
jgi:hypothetical protein